MQVDYPSVIRGVGLLLQPQPGDEIAHVYALIDTKGRGVVTKDDVVNAVKKDAGVRDIIRGSTTMRNLLHPTACAAAFSRLKVKRSGGIVQLPKFKKWVETCVGTEVPPLANVIEEVFRLIDADGSGGVDKDEIFHAVRFDEVVRDVLQLADSLKRLLRPREFREVFAQLDADGSGLVSLKEFRAFALGVSADEIANPRLSSDGPQSADPVGDLFALLDKDYSGNVEKGEMLKAIRSDARVRELLRHTESLQVLLRPAAFETAFADLDVDDSGLVWLDEFRAFAEGLSKRVPKPTSDDIISEVFALIDTNQSGDLDKDEIVSAVHDNEAVRDIIHLSQHLLILLRPQTFDAAFAAMRTRKSGKVTLDEFRAFATGLVKAREEAALEGAATHARLVDGEKNQNGKEKGNEKGAGKGIANGKKQKQKQAAIAKDASWRAPSGMASFLGDASHADSHKVALDDLFCEESPWFHRAVLCRGFKSHMTHEGELEQSGIVIGRRMRHTGAKSQNKPRAQARRGSSHAMKVERHNSERKFVVAEARSVEEHQITFADGVSDWVPLSTETDASGRKCRLADLKSPEDLQHCMWLRHFLGGAACASAEAHLSDRMLELLHTLQDHQAEIAKSAAHEHLVGHELVDHHVRVQLIPDGPWDHAVALEYHEKSADHLLAFQDGSTSCVNLSKVHYVVCDSAAGQSQSDQAVVDSHWVGDFLRKYMKAQEGGKVIATSRMAARAAAASAAAHADDTETFAVGGVVPLRTASMPFKVAERLKLEHAKDVKALEIAQNKIKQLEAAANLSTPEQTTADAQDMIKHLEAQLASQAKALEAATVTPEAVPRPDSVVDQIFVSLDKDGSGSVPKMELYRAMKDDHQIRGRMEACEALKSLLHPRTFIGAFKLLDADGSGQVTLAEFRVFAFRAVTEKPTVADVVGDVFALISAEVSGPVTKMGLLRAIKNNPQVRDALRLSPSLRDLLHPRKVLRAFKLLDVDGSGDITLDEFRVFAARVAESGAAAPDPDAIAELFAALDKGGDGTVEKREILVAVKSDAAVRDLLRASETLQVLLRPRAFAQAFKSLDAQSTGRVTLAQFRAFANGLANEATPSSVVVAISESKQGSTTTNDIDALFALIDKDGTGTLEKREILRAVNSNASVRDMLKLSEPLKALLRPRAFAAAFKTLDGDKSGCVNLPEFRAFALNLTQGSATSKPDDVGEVFSLIDADGSGKVDKAEILRAVRNNSKVRDILSSSDSLKTLMKPRAFAEAFKKLDTNRSGDVTLAGFRTFAKGLSVESKLPKETQPEGNHASKYESKHESKHERTLERTLESKQESKRENETANDIDVLFALIDKDGTGTLEKREILRAVNSNASVRDMLKLSEPLKALLRPRAFAAAFKTLDGDKSGCVNLPEFRAFALNLTQGSATSKPDDVGEVFSLIDADGSGKVDKAEILRAVRNNSKVRDILSSSDSLKTLMKPRAFAEAFKKLDTNRSGDVTLAGFRTFAKGLSVGNTMTKNDDVAKVFALMDNDGSDMVDKAEILRAVRDNAEVRDLLRASGDGLGALLRPRAFKAAFARLSSNVEGLVSMQDFRALAASLVTRPKSADAMAPGLEDQFPAAPGPLAARHCASLGLSGNSVTGNLLRVKWTHDNDWQLGLVVCFSRETKKHLVHYADGDAIWHDMKPLRHEVIDFESGQKEELKAVLWAVPYLENDIKVAELVASREYGDDKDLMAQVEREVRAELNLPAGANVFEQDDAAHEGYIQLAHRKLLLGRIRHSLRGAEMLPEHSPEHGDELVDELIRVEWSGGEWHAGIVEDYDAELGQHFIEYEDGDLQWHDLKATKFALIDVLDQTSLEGLDWAVDVVQNNMKHMIGSSGAVRHSKWVLLSKLYLIQVIDHPCSVRQSDGSWRTGIILELERESGRHLIEYSDNTVEWVVLRETEHRLLDATYIKEPAVVSWLSKSLTAKAAERSARGISTKVAWTKLLAALLRGGDRSVSPDTDAIPGRQALALADADHAANLGLTGQALVGRRISVQWQDSNNAAGNWYDGKVEKHDPVKKRHLVAYDDGELKWEEISTLHHRVHPQEGGGAMPTSIPAAHKQHAALLGLERENLVGHRVSVQWGDANDGTGGKWYDGVVKQFDGKLGLHLIKYDDGDAKWESMATLHHRVHGTTRTRSAEGGHMALSPSAHPHHARHLGLEGAALVGHIINVQWAHSAAGNSNVRRFIHGF